MSIYRFLLTLVLPILLLAMPQAGRAAEAEKLNFVVVLVDDLGWTDLGCFGSSFYETPHIDKLCADGMKFTNAYAACAVCSPTRAAVMTGRYPARVGITDWIRARFQGGGLPADGKNPSGYVGSPNQKILCPRNPLWMERSEITVAELLHDSGYVSCHIGKWHLGMDDWYPEHQGFDFNYGGCDYGQPPSYFDPFTNNRLKQGIPGLKPRKPGQYLSDREAEEAADFIKRNHDKPFFLYLANYAVHTPIQAKQDVAAKYDAKEKKSKQTNAKYAAMVESVDDCIGVVRKTLAELNLTDNTVIIFTSDNGGLLGPTHNAPLRLGKGHPHEGGIRVPMIVSWPGAVKGGSVSEEPVISVDILPTIAEAAGLDVKHTVDGLSLVEHLKSAGQKALERDAIFWHFPHFRGRGIPPYSIVRAGDWKLIKRYAGLEYELYNLREDLGETTNLATEMPDKVGELNKKIEAWLQHVEAKVPKPNPNYRAPKR